MTSMRELISQIDGDPTLPSAAAKGDALMKAVHPEDRLKGMHALASLVFTLPKEAAASVVGKPLQVEQRCADCASREDAGRPAQTSSNIRPERRYTKAVEKRPAHASPRILAARAAWRDWLETRIVLPDANTKVAIGDMTAPQLQDVAHALYDAHLQLHSLADAITEAGVTTARELPDDAAALVLGAAS